MSLSGSINEWDNATVLEAGPGFAVDWDNRIVDASASITDLVTFHKSLRALEAGPTGINSPVIHTYRALDVGGGAFFYAVDFINGWRLRFPNAGNYTINGNLNAQVIGVPGVFVMQTKALAFATTSATGGEAGAGVSADDVANKVWGHPFVAKLLTVGKFLGLK